MPRVDQVEDAGNASTRREVRLGDRPQLRDRLTAASRIAVTRQIGEMDAPASGASAASIELEAVQVRQPGLAGRRARARQGALLGERIDERRLPDVRSAHERDVRHIVARYTVRGRCTRDEPGRQQLHVNDE